MTTRQKKPTKTTRKVLAPETYLQMHLEQLNYDWSRLTQRVMWQLTEGGGYKNIHMLETLRSLQTVYYQIASAEDALRHTKSPV
jgi:hypothetical protein